MALEASTSSGLRPGRSDSKRASASPDLRFATKRARMDEASHSKTQRTVIASTDDLFNRRLRDANPSAQSSSIRTARFVSSEGTEDAMLRRLGRLNRVKDTVTSLERLAESQLAQSQPSKSAPVVQLTVPRAPRLQTDSRLAQKGARERPIGRVASKSMKASAAFAPPTQKARPLQPRQEQTDIPRFQRPLTKSTKPRVVPLPDTQPARLLVARAQLTRQGSVVDRLPAKVTTVQSPQLVHKHVRTRLAPGATSERLTVTSPPQSVLREVEPLARVQSFEAYDQQASPTPSRQSTPSPPKPAALAPNDTLQSFSKTRSTTSFNRSYRKTTRYCSEEPADLDYTLDLPNFDSPHADVRLSPAPMSTPAVRSNIIDFSPLLEEERYLTETSAEDAQSEADSSIAADDDTVLDPKPDSSRSGRDTTITREPTRVREPSVDSSRRRPQTSHLDGRSSAAQAPPQHDPLHISPETSRTTPGSSQAPMTTRRPPSAIAARLSSAKKRFSKLQRPDRSTSISVGPVLADDDTTTGFDIYADQTDQDDMLAYERSIAATPLADRTLLQEDDLGERLYAAISGK
ncbi:uncharacterized protein L969DRAFT_94310 [Mixia osmundae IAM 14324]|uniref:Uncharacterized protein n=1 Tax=Mixia osmundae (strain CBS 9802 / IAM 14324 / JCM 22182 / KY 12970) TaxID=764103 RepID=G7E8H3_MIXOS|nr:uncharacterized protein L969DRAFT_94310 [Mixia osmundae IAM 14324]KEI39235.1 hypothetical protein L969DRAFT_94310 [Mixia osmundae IAM 14324]GAA99133.1 hypothetical protein E5Q_05823 [Mixia osmundae IAM 14324]